MGQRDRIAFTLFLSAFSLRPDDDKERDRRDHESRRIARVRVFLTNSIGESVLIYFFLPAPPPSSLPSLSHNNGQDKVEGNTRTGRPDTVRARSEKFRVDVPREVDAAKVT